MKLITKSRESIREGLLYWKNTGKMPELSDGAEDIFAKIIYIFDQHQILRNQCVTIEQLIQKKAKSKRKDYDQETSNLFIEISVRRQVIENLVNEFSPITYQQACKDYQFASEILNMNVIESAVLNLSVAEEECFDAYQECRKNGDFANAEKFMNHYIKINQSKPKAPPKLEARPTRIIAEWNPALIKGCEVIETLEELDIFENEMKKQYSSEVKTASGLLQKMATDVASEEVKEA